MKQALKQSFTHLLKTTFPTGIILSLSIYLFRWLVAYNSIDSFSEEAGLFLLIVAASCCTTYTARFIVKSLRMIR
jgi:hypothetical protein